jgi:uncharacterized membrane protein YbhN (UPF0104 family)
MPMETEAEKKKRKKRLGHILFILLNVAVIGVTAYIEFGTGKTASKENMLDVNMWYLFLVLGCFLICIASETMKYVIIIRHTTGVWSLREGFMVAITGKYYDFITPLSAGGQPPSRPYIWSTEGLKPARATAIPIAGFLTRHAAFIIIALVVLIFGGSVPPATPCSYPAIFGLFLRHSRAAGHNIFFGPGRPKVTEAGPYTG